MTTPDQHSGKPDIDGPAQARLRASRRALILNGLGKGSVALAALSPLASQAIAIRSHKLTNATLPGGFGYCTISGFQSAAVSGSPAPTVCSAFAPSHFLTTPEALTYSTLTAQSAVDKDTLATALNSHFGLSVGTISASLVEATLLASIPVTLVAPGPASNLVILPLTAGTATALRGRNFPGTLTNFAALFKSIFTSSTDARTIMAVLYDDVLSSTPASGNCYFMAAYLTVYGGTPSTLPAGFDTSYLTGAYTSDASAAAGSDAYQFLNALCTTP